MNWIGLKGGEYPIKLKIEGHDNAIVGIVERIYQENILCYDKNIIIKNLMKDMSEEEAIEYFEFNIIGAYMGEFTPCFIDFNWSEEDET